MNWFIEQTPLLKVGETEAKQLSLGLALLGLEFPAGIQHPFCRPPSSWCALWELKTHLHLFKQICYP
jgi:hypothetical protein